MEYVERFVQTLGDALPVGGNLNEYDSSILRGARASHETGFLHSVE